VLPAEPADVTRGRARALRDVHPQRAGGDGRLGRDVREIERHDRTEDFGRTVRDADVEIHVGTPVAS
jgi:hypothetical protein